MQKARYLYVYLSNEGRTADGGNVYFDELRINHKKGHIIQEDHYYPFGMSINALSSSAPLSKPNRFKFGSQELQAEFDLNWYDYGARNFDTQLGRWNVIDPLAFDYHDNSPYHYSGNNPILFKDVDGRYYVDADGNKIETTVDENGKIVLGENATDDLSKMVQLINESGSETAISQFLKVGANETKVHFQFSNEFVVDTKTERWKFGFHQAHDSEGKALDWDPIKGEFDGEISFIQDSEGNSVYKEATITVYNLAINLLSPDKKTANAFIVSTNAHENEHDLNKDDIKAIKDRQEGVKNDRDVEVVATEIGKRVIREINGSK